MDLIIFRMTAAITAASWTVARTGSGIGAADALDALLLCPADISDSQAQNDNNDSNGQKIDIIHRLTYGSRHSLP